MAFKLDSIILVGLALFVVGLILPFVDVFIIKYYGKSAESIGSFILFASLSVFVIGVIIALVGFHRQGKQAITKHQE